MAYSCTISIDPIHKEIIFILQDCSDVINILHLIQKEMVNKYFAKNIIFGLPNSFVLCIKRLPTIIIFRRNFKQKR